MSAAVDHITAKGIMARSNRADFELTANPYVGCLHDCKICPSSYMKRTTEHSETWGAFVDVKHWPKIKDPIRYDGRTILIGSTTDPYQPAEKSFKRTRSLLEQLEGTRAEITISTKSELVLRDIDVLKKLENVKVMMMLNSLDEAFRAALDGGDTYEKRLSAMRELTYAGVRVVCGVSPIFPGLTNVRAVIRRARTSCEAIYLEELTAKGANKKLLKAEIVRSYPSMAELYRQIYDEGSGEYWLWLDDDVRLFAQELDLPYIRWGQDLPEDEARSPAIVNKIGI